MAGRISITDLRQRLSGAFEQLRDSDEWIVITRYGEAAAALVSVNLLCRALELAEADGTEEMLEAKSAIRTKSPSETERDSVGDVDRIAAAPNADDLLERIDRTRGAVGLPPLSS